MPNSQTLPQEFEELLSRMPRIAEAVNKFTSEDNQRTALDALLSPFRLSQEPATHAEAAGPALSVVQPLDDGHDKAHHAEGSAPGAIAPSGTARRRTRNKKALLRAKDINFRPEGKTSLQQFAADKAPADMNEKNVVAVYYLEEILSIPGIEPGHVLAAFIECGWPLPADPENSLRKTASVKKWLNTGDSKAIHLTFPGRNTVEHDMPRAKATKSA